MNKVVQISDSASRLGGGIPESIRGLCRGLSSSGRWEPVMVAQFDAFCPADTPAWGTRHSTSSPKVASTCSERVSYEPPRLDRLIFCIFTASGRRQQRGLESRAE